MTITVEKGPEQVDEQPNHLVLYPNFNYPYLTIRGEPFQVIKGAIIRDIIDHCYGLYDISTNINSLITCK